MTFREKYENKEAANEMPVGWQLGFNAGFKAGQESIPPIWKEEFDKSVEQARQEAKKETLCPNHDNRPKIFCSKCADTIKENAFNEGQESTGLIKSLEETKEIENQARQDFAERINNLIADRAGCIEDCLCGDTKGLIDIIEALVEKKKE